ncbi:MAG: hypothetical protein ABI130_15370 [Leifsonia sp.]
MTTPDELLLRVQWGGRGESTEKIVDRVCHMLTFFEQMGGLYAEPFWSTEPVLISGDRGALEELVNVGYSRDEETGVVYRTNGSSIALMQHPLGAYLESSI